MYKSLFISCLFLGLFFTSKVGLSKAISFNHKQTEISLDSAQIKPAKFDKEALQEYKNQKSFKYDDAPTTELSLWDRFWMWFWDLVGRIFAGAASNPISKWFFIILGVAVVVFIIIKLIGTEQIFSKKSKATNFSYDLTENIHDIDYEAELNRFIAQENYRHAVRLLYLRCLKKLSDAEIITWKPDKTNFNYLAELKDLNLKDDFSALTFQFDYIWYGDFPIDKNGFAPINQSFKNFNSQIK
ncbi:DUF4129 domain-containing protein [Pedobacter changchengzhani]|uniref:DUF4129 domain-containing protein n=1 Tax=Pedobacter changchengzhani TaxID=2529274 RepID=A0A4R5MN17_9SPHI|nr:DUF4129 domain-containing protein [Pedobacter changchengzhani]TDG37191.1 DUF4129 domain-containing protein [Pedobacter changchengzhani]